jgi:hypothetical protein
MNWVLGYFIVGNLVFKISSTPISLFETDESFRLKRDFSCMIFSGVFCRARNSWVLFWVPRESGAASGFLS